MAESFDRISAGSVTATEELVTAASSATYFGGKSFDTSFPQSVTITPAAGASNTCNITIQVFDGAGLPCLGAHELHFWISEATTGIGLTADSYSGSVTASTGGVLSTLTAKKDFIIQTAATGIAVIAAVDSAKPADQYFCVGAVGAKTRTTVSVASGVLWG